MGNVLEGIRVVDLTRVLAGPYATMLLGDLGADVIKVEDPAGDPTRRMGPPFEADGRSPYFMAVNRNKRGVVLDLKQSGDYERFLDLVRESDVVIDNYRPGVTARLKIDPECLRRVKPDIVTCSITAFGADGPYQSLPAFDLILQAMSGGMSITGQPGIAPQRAGIPIGDLAGGIFAAFAVCAALLHRDRSGEGQHVDLGLLDVQVSLLTYVAQYYLTDGRVPGPLGTSHQNLVPYQAFKSADNYLVVAVFGESFWAPLCVVLGLELLIERYPDNASRQAHRDDVVAALQTRFSERSTEEWIRELWAAGVPSGPINTVDLVLKDPQIAHRSMVATDTERRLVGNPVKTGVVDRFTPAPALGQHNAEIFGTEGWEPDDV
jgi:crotonobetainyl-CoA:carnitine CoA-transferase CaiB-like acyl-CoA transferase